MDQGPQIRAQLHVPEWKLYNALQFLSSELGVGKPLEVDDENLWQRPEIQLLRGQLVLFTNWTVPENTTNIILHHSQLIITKSLCVCYHGFSSSSVSTVVKSSMHSCS